MLDKALLGLARSAAAVLGRDSRLKQALQPIFEASLELLTRRAGLRWDINGTPCRILAKHRNLLPRDYDAKVADFVRARVKPGQIIFDVGANLGAYTLQFANWVGPSGRVFAFEPNLNARRVLERHLSLSGLAERVTIVGEAVSNAEGRARLFFADLDAKSRLGAPNPALAGAATAVDVDVTTIDRVCQRFAVAPNWIKIDIEGFELQALEGALRTLRSAELAGLIVEMHPPWDETGEYRAKLTRLLAEYQLIAHGLVGQKDPLGQHAMVWLEPARKM
jgi:FkbM family methyltransferase